MKLDDLDRIFFIGIGGIGMSALARFLNDQNKDVFGYDRTETKLTKTLVREGMQISYEDAIESIPDSIDMVVYTPAIPSTNKHLLYFQKEGMPMLKRSEFLGLVSKSLRCIGIAGTHGKTTTSCLLTYVLKEGGVDCNAFLGGISKDFATNYVQGDSDWLVVEADEYDRSFLRLSPEIGSILSAEPDHLDIYGDASQIVETGFKAYAELVKRTLFVNAPFKGLFPSYLYRFVLLEKLLERWCMGGEPGPQR